MTVKDDEQLRAWCIDYSLRLGSSSKRLKPSTVIKDAKVIEQYVTARPTCEIKLIAPTGKPRAPR